MIVIMQLEADTYNGTPGYRLSGFVEAHVDPDYRSWLQGQMSMHLREWLTEHSNKAGLLELLPIGSLVDVTIYDHPTFRAFVTGYARAHFDLVHGRWEYPMLRLDDGAVPVHYQVRRENGLSFLVGADQVKKVGLKP